MSPRIAGTDFSWNPAEESRHAVWQRLREHIVRELERIGIEHRTDRHVAMRVMRHERTPFRERNLEIYEAFHAGEMTIRELAQKHGLSYGRIRSIIQNEERFRAWKDRQ
jgi:Mor family transcriptional regulator